MILIRYDDKTVDISGHSLPDICAAVSAIAYTTVNALLCYDEDNTLFEDDGNNMSIGITNDNEVMRLLFENMIGMLEQMSGQYKQYIKIIKKTSD